MEKIGLFLFAAGLLFIGCESPKANFLSENKPGHQVINLNEMNLADSNTVNLFFCGDVMTGRGIDQILPYAGNPKIHESYITDSRDYIKIAEDRNGKIPRKVPFDYIWGVALSEFDKHSPDLKIINLETSVTTSNDHWKGKGIHYRMHPKNTPCLTAAGIDFCSLANNHVLDWGYDGLLETLKTLKKNNISYAGAGENFGEARRPAVLDIGEKGRVIIYAFGMPSSGVFQDWLATEESPGVNVLESLSSNKLQLLKVEALALKQPGDLLVASIHWGGNWGYHVPNQQKKIARQLIDEAGFDIIHGHSSHHFKGIEVYKSKPILYGCGDFLTDYEGIRGHDEFKNELTFMYFLKMDRQNGELLELRLVPLEMRKFRLQYASPTDVQWMKAIMERECRMLGTDIKATEHNNFLLTWK